MSKVDLQTPIYNIVGDPVSVKANHQVPDSVLNSNDRVTPEELKEISMFSYDSTAVKTALGIGAVAAGSVALAYGAKRFGLLNKLFPLVEESGLQYRKILGKKFGLKPSSPYANFGIPNNSLMGKRVKNPHPANLRNELERCDYSRQEVIKLINSNPKLDKLVGNVPSSWMQGKNSKTIRQEIDNVLSKFAKDFHAAKRGRADNAINTDTLSKELSAILGDNVEIVSLGGGCIGNAYKITTKGESFVYKVYYNKPFLTLGNLGHGNYAELAAAIRAQKLCPKKFTPLYMGKFGKNESGYMLTKFIPEGNIEKELSYMKEHPKFSDLLRKMETTDGGSENIHQGNITVDFGNTYLTAYSYLSPKAQKIARELFPVLDGKSPEKVRKVAQKHLGTKEFEEVKTFMEKCDISSQYKTSKRANLAEIGIELKPTVEEPAFYNRMT